MTIDTCHPCSNACLYQSTISDDVFKRIVLNVLCDIYQQGVAEVVRDTAQLTIGRINGTYNGANQTVVASPGLGKKLVIRSLYAQVEDSATDVAFNSRTAGGVNTALMANMDFSANSGMVLNTNVDGWFETKDNESLVVTSNAAVDMIGTYAVVDV